MRAVGREPGAVYNKRGHGAIDRDLVGRWNRTSNSRPMLVLRDLDPRPPGTTCMSSVVEALCGGPVVAPSLALRLPVHELESWVLADADEVMSFFHLRSVPRDDPDSLIDPKRELVRLCSRSTSRTIRDGMAPRADGGRAVGPAYEDLLIEFAERWDPVRAAARSNSLDRALRRLGQLCDEGVW